MENKKSCSRLRRLQGFSWAVNQRMKLQFEKMGKNGLMLNIKKLISFNKSIMNQKR